MGIVFGLYLAFTAAQVWGDIDRANAAVNREASALSAIVILAASFPGAPEQQTHVWSGVTLKTPRSRNGRRWLGVTGEISVGPGPLLQVLPEEKTS